MAESLKWRIAQFLEIRWWRRYLGKKDASEYRKWKEQYWNNFLNGLKTDLGLSESRDILEIGCGPAGINSVLGEHRLTAIDPLLTSYRELDVFDASCENHVFIAEGIEEFQTERRFPIVFCLNVINHVNDIEKAFERINELTAVSGYFVLSIDVHRFSLLKHIFRIIPGDALHPHQFSLTEYEDMMRKQNFEILETQRLKREAIFDYYVLVGKKKD